MHHGIISFERSRVLVVDDDPILREFATAALVSDMVTVETAVHGRDGLDRLLSDDFDVALVDLDMPVMDGFQLIACVRSNERLKHLPIVVATGRTDTDAIDRAFAAGASSFVVKPLNWRLVAYQLSYVLKASREETRIRLKARALHDRLRGQDELVNAYDASLHTLLSLLLEHQPDLTSVRGELEHLRRRRHMAR